MKEGFTEVDNARFYGEFWPRLRNRAEAIESNLEHFKNPLAWAPQPHKLIIHWGYLVPVTKRPAVLAITVSGGHDPDRHWLAPEMLK